MSLGPECPTRRLLRAQARARPVPGFVGLGDILTALLAAVAPPGAPERPPGAPRAFRGDLQDHPLVAAVLRAFPGAEIVGTREISLAPPESGA